MAEHEASRASAPLPAPGEAVADTRPSSLGAARLLFALLAAASLLFAWRAVLSSSEAFRSGHPLTALLTIVAALLWIAGVAGIIHNGRRMRRLAGAAWLANLVCPLLALALGNVGIDPVSPWYSAGSTYWYLPVVGAAGALAWLAWSSPTRLASRGG